MSAAGLKRRNFMKSGSGRIPMLNMKRCEQMSSVHLKSGDTLITLKSEPGMSIISV